MNFLMRGVLGRRQLGLLVKNSFEVSRMTYSKECIPPEQECLTPPPCPPKHCPVPPEPGNPCNYCPPTCIDPDYPDLTRIKKRQCEYQEDDDIPIHLKTDKDVILYQITIVLTVIALIKSCYTIYTLSKL